MTKFVWSDTYRNKNELNEVVKRVKSSKMKYHTKKTPEGYELFLDANEVAKRARSYKKVKK